MKARLEIHRLAGTCIAAEVHDSLSQRLVIIKNRAPLGLQTPTEASRLTSQLEEIAESTVYVIDEVKESPTRYAPFTWIGWG